MESGHPKRCPLKAQPLKWKEKFREKCLSRAREIRYQFIQTSRLSGKSAIHPKATAVSALEQIVSDEQIKIGQSSSGDIQSAVVTNIDDALWDCDPSEQVKELDNDEYEEILFEMQRLLYEDIGAYSQQRDAASLEDYEKACELEEESLASAFFEHMQIHKEQNVGLICPICRKGYLKQRPQLIYCEFCDLQLNIQSDQVDIELLRKRLSEVLEEHYSKGCKEQTRFFVERQFDISALYMHCRMCEAFELVL
uniref:RPA-interacting protein C-terminal domain-containing protein n=1 Tax=Araucaria cunninghamii TaxID=56994 RepID=A0A0D6R8T1_ARACU